MKISANGSNIILEEVFSGIELKSEAGETFGICMRDSGFEFMYGGKWYEAKGGKVGPRPIYLMGVDPIDMTSKPEK